MKRYLCFVAILLGAVLPGCFVDSVYPLHDDQTTVFVESLLGDYKVNKENPTTHPASDDDLFEPGVLSVQRGPGNSYVITPVDEEGVRGNPLSAYLVKLGESYFVELEQDLSSQNLDPPLKKHYSIARVSLDGNQIRFWNFKDKSFLDWPDARTQEVWTITRAEDGTEKRTPKDRLLAMPTKELQAFFQAHAAQMDRRLQTWTKIGPGAQ